MSNISHTIFTGDANSLVAASERGKRAEQDREKTIKKTGAAAKSLGDQLEQTFTGMAKGVLITAAIAKSIEAAADAAKRLREASAQASETRGGEAVRVEQALMASGAKMTAEQRQSILGMVGEGVVKPEESVSFIEAYAKKRGRRLTYADITRATQAYQSGAYTQEELMDMRMPPSLIAQRERFSQMTPEARAELGIRFRENIQQATIREAVPASASARMVDNELRSQQLTSPFLSAIPDAINSLPIIGPAVREAAISDLRAQMEGGSYADTMKQVIRKVARPDRPAVIEGNRE